MKYYWFQGSPATMEDRQFKILLRIQPDVVELTKEEYENRMGIRPEGVKEKENKDVGQPVGAHPKAKDETPIRTIRSRPEAIKILRQRGVPYADLKTKTKAELNKLL